MWVRGSQPTKPPASRHAPGTRKAPKEVAQVSFNFREGFAANVLRRLKTAHQEFPDRVKVVVTDVDPALESQMLGFEFTPTDEGYERSFEGRPDDLMVVLGRFQEALEPMVRQLAGWDPVPWQSALKQFVRSADSSIDWWLVGSTALAVRGIPIEPRDVDIVVAEEDFSKTNNLFEQFIVEPAN